MTLTRSFLLPLLATFSIGASADVLLIEQVRQAGKMDVPVNGLSMSEVEARFGSPEQKQAAVGDPPISRWVYDQWSVYFEYDRALFTVLDEGEVIEDRWEPEGEAADDGQDGTNDGFE
jgi:hypothetical protein